MLYAPPPPRPDASATLVAATTPPAPTPPEPTIADRPPPPVKPEDFLPYFQLNDGTPGSAPEGLHFTPAQPASRAEFHQK